ncbi:MULTISPECIES: GHMP kinase [unclassified Mesorhizobium]|uniref:GHMP family kinase ATP-binding protein n=1 Tax=unclassified Mesorhizobium TaxID=325217 RepID=UPI000FD5FC1A|nr:MULTISPECIES: GHMP kinase [unclassified Mesorhizobium]RUW21603.1 GHMP kinase [Mesorhizobium sp. M4B.F.Ca.ET.013.02.1.1]TGV22680.1 GHMP kinase [Mesorhizobium sp. M4B.F.Ca.ET.143.01.1.1]
MRATEGCGEAIGHHGELVQGIFEDQNARLHRGLISLPCRHLKSKAKFRTNGEERLSVTPRHCEKAKRAVELALKTFARITIGGHLTIESNIPIGRGMGSSTADVLASILAVLNYLDLQSTPDRVMEIAVSAETACDSTLFSQQAVLFAHREGFVIESFRNPLPPIDVISVDTTPSQTVDTLLFKPAQYNPFEIGVFRPLRSVMRRAINDSDVGLLGRVATASALINERFLPKPRLHDIEAIGTRYGALGVQVAHSGTVVGLMFDPANQRSTENMDLAMRDLRKLGLEPSIFRH